MSEKRCGDCKYFVAFRNYNYETCTNDTITEYCELLQNEAIYDRDKGDEIWNDVFDDCPLEIGYVSTESAILLLQSKEEVHKFFDNYVRSSCEKEKKLQDENEVLLEEWSERQQYFKKVEDEYHERIIEQQATIQKQSERIRELESILADDIALKYEIKEAWKQRTEKRWNNG